MEFIEKFKNYLLGSSSKASQVTVKNYLADIRHFITWVEATYKKSFSPSDITIQVINQFKNDKAPILSASSIDRHISSLRKFFTFLKLNGDITHSPFDVSASQVQGTSDPYHLHDFKNYLYVYNASHLTIKNYIIDVKQFIAWAEEVLRVHDAWKVSEKNILLRVNTKLLEEYRDRLFAEHVFSASSINRKLSSLRKYLAWARENGLVGQDVEFMNYAGNKEKENEGTIFSQDERRSPVPRKNSFPSELITDQFNNTANTIQTKRGYSNIPPIRLIQKMAKASTMTFDVLITAPVAHLFKKVEHETWKLRGKPLFVTGKRLSNILGGPATRQFPLSNAKAMTHFQLGKRNFKLSNISKNIYAPLLVSTRDFPWYKKILHHLRYTRPNWYHRYHRLAIAHYFNWAVLIIFATAIGVGMYNNFVEKPGKSLAALPNQPIRVLSFQGRLTDANSNPITNPTWIRFIIYNTQSSSSSARLWEEVDKVSPDSDGIFSLLLGSSGASDGSAAGLCNSGNPPTSPATGACGIPQSLFANNNALWLGVTVEATSELAPREQLATVAFASNAETLQGLPPITQSGAGTNNVVLALNSSGNLSIGASTTFQSTSGQFTLSGNTLALQTNSGTNGNITLAPDGIGTIDLQRPLQTSTNNGDIASVPNALTIEDIAAILATSSGQSALTIVQNGTGPIISASHSSTPEFTVDSSGNTTVNGNLTVNGTQITDNTYAGNNAVLYAAPTTGLFTATTTNSVNQCLISGSSIPRWSTCTTGGYWQLNGPVLSPADLNNDLAVGGNSTTSAKFQVFAESVGPVVAGTASTSGNLTFTAGSPVVNILNGSSLAFKTSPGGDSGTGYINALTIGPNTIQFYNSSNSLTSSGNLSLAGTITLPNSNTITGTSNYLQVSNGISVGGATTYHIDGNGNAVLNSINLPIGGGLDGYWNLTAGALAPSNIQNDVVVGGTATTSARFHAYGTVNQGTTPAASAAAKTSYATVVVDNSGTGDLFTASTSGLPKFTITNGGNVNFNQLSTIGVTPSNTGLTVNSNGTGTLTLDSTGAGTVAIGANATTINVGTSNTATTLALGSGTGANTITLGNNQTGGSISVGNALTTGTISLGGSATTGTITIGQYTGTSNSTINIGHATVGNGGNQTIGIGDSATGTGIDTITIGNTNGASVLSLKAGTGGLSLVGAPVSINTSGSGNTSIGNGTGTITLTLGSDATGDLFYRNNSGNLTRLADVATGSCLVSGGVGSAPTWATCASGSGSGTNYWQLNGKVVSPADLNNDLAVGGNSTTSAKFQVFAESVGPVVAGTASTSGNLTFTAGSPVVNILNGSSLAFKTSPSGDFGTGYNTILTLGNNASTTSLSTGNNNLSLLAGSGVITLGTAGGGNIQFFSSSNTIDSNGNLTLNGNATIKGTTITLANGATIDTLNSSGTINIGTGANTSALVLGKSGGTISISSSLNADLIPTGNGSINLGSASHYYNVVYANSFSSPVGNGVQGFWTVTNNTNLYPSNTADDLLIGGTATNSASLQIFSQTVTGNPAIAGTASTSGYLTFRDAAGTNPVINYLNGNSLVFKSSPGGDFGTGYITTLTLDPAGNLTTTGNLAVNGGTITSSGGTTTIGNAFAITGNLVSSLLPDATTRNLGSSGQRFGTIWGTNLQLPITGGVGGYWNLTSGTTTYGILAPANLQNDLAVGGNATGSATPFQIFGEQYTNDGSINSGTVTAGTATTSGNLSFRGATGSKTTFQVNYLNGANLGFFYSAGGDKGLSATNPTLFLSGGNVGINTTSPTAFLDVNGAASVSSTLTFHAGGGTIQATKNEQLTLGGNTTGGITFGSNVNSNIIPTLADTFNLGSATNEWNNLYVKQIISPSGGGVSGYWQLNAGVLAPVNVSNDLVVGDNNPANIPATSSALFQVFGGTYGGEPGGTASTAGDLTFRNAGVINVLGGNSLSVKTAIAGEGDAGLNTVLTLTNGGNLGINNTSPAVRVDASQGSQSTLTSIQQTLSNNGIAISTTNGVTGNYYPGLMWYTTDNNPTKPKAGIWVQGTASGTNLMFGTTNTPGTGITNQAFTINPNGFINIGTVPSTPLSYLELNNSTLTASGKALQILDQYELNGDIFTASASGTTRFVIQNNGDVGINVATPSGILEVDSQGTALPSDLVLNQSATTNLITNPSFEGSGGSSTGWSLATATTVSNDRAVFGQYSIKLVGAGSNYHSFANCISDNGSTAYGISEYMFVTSSYSAGTPQIRIQEWQSAGCTGTTTITAIATGQTSITNAWQRVSTDYTTKPTTKSFEITFSNLAATGTIYADGFQVEKSSGVTQYIDGSLGPGYNWTGAPNNSTSVRIGGAAFTYGSFNHASGIGAASGGFNPTLQLDQDGTGDIFTASASGTTELQLTNSGQLFARNLYDLDNPIYYIDPAGLTTSASLAGSITFTPSSEHDINYMNGSGLNFRRSAGGDGVAGANFTSTLYLANTGFVGVNNTAPSDTLDITGNATESGNLSFRGTNTNHNLNLLNGGQLSINTSVGGLGTLNTSLFIANGNNATAGFVGINNTTPSDTLDITGNATESGNFSFRGTNTLHKINILNGGQLEFATSVGGTGAVNPALYIQPVNSASTSAYIGINNTNPSRNIDVTGTWGGNTVVDSRTLTSSQTVAESTPALIYRLSNDEGTTAGNVTITFNITGVPSIEGSFFMASIHAIKQSTTGGVAETTKVILQVNTVQVGSITSTSTSAPASVAQNWLLGYDNGIWTAFGQPSTLDAQNNDLAEWIHATGVQPESGELLTNAGNISVQRSNKEYDQGAIGIVTTNPNTVYGQPSTDGESTQLALTGRVPAIVTSINGPILSGDGITTSPFVGVGMKPTRPTQVVGKALENFDPSQSSYTDVASLNDIVWPEDTGENENHPVFRVPVSSLDASTQALLAKEYNLHAGDYFFVGKVMVQVGNSYVDPNVYLTTTGDMHLADTQPSIDFTIPHYYSLSDAFGHPLQQMGAFLELAVANLRAGSVQAQQVLTNSLAVATDNVNIAGQSLHDYIASVVSQVLQKQQNTSGITSPVADNNIQTNLISPLASDSAIAIRLNNSKIEIAKDASSSAVASIDNNGNATFSGTLNSQNLAVGGDATISGTLYANNIKANSIEGLQEVVSTLSAQNITNVTNIYFATPSGSPLAANNITGSENPSSQSSSLLGTPSNFPTSYADISSFSAYFAYVPNLNAVTGTFQQGLVSLGPTSLTDTSITGTLSIGSQMELADNSINVLGADLELQPLRQGGIAFAGHKVYIDSDGNLTVNGTATFTKGVATNLISPLSGNDLTIQLGNPASSASAQNTQLNVHNASGSAIFAVNQSGDLMASGEATIGKLNFNLVAPAYALSDTEVVATGSAGTASIHAYQKEVTIDDSNVTANSLIYITPVGTNQTPYLERQVSGKSFTVGIPTVLPTSVNFNWLIVN